MAGPVVQHQDDLPPGRLVPGLQRRQIAGEAGRVLPHLEHLDPPPSQRLDAAEDRQPPVGARRRHGRLRPDPMPDPAEVRVGVQMGLVLIVQLIPLRLAPAPFSPAARRAACAGGDFGRVLEMSRGCVWAGHRRSAAACSSTRSQPGAMRTPVCCVR